MRGEGGERGSHRSAAPPSTPFPTPRGCLQPHMPGTLFTALTVRAITLLTKREWTKSTYQKLTMATEEETRASGGRELNQHWEARLLPHSGSSERKYSLSPQNHWQIKLDPTGREKIEWGVLLPFGSSIMEKFLDRITTQGFLGKDGGPSYLPRGSESSHMPLIRLVP